jgi:hypothetical protein
MAKKLKPAGKPKVIKPVKEIIKDKIKIKPKK